MNLSEDPWYFKNKNTEVETKCLVQNSKRGRKGCMESEFKSCPDRKDLDLFAEFHSPSTPEIERKQL